MCTLADPPEVLLVYRLWKANHCGSRYGRVGSSQIKSVMFTILDAAIVYWALILAALVTTLTAKVLHFVFLDLVSAVVLLCTTYIDIDPHIKDRPHCCFDYLCHIRAVCVRREPEHHFFLRNSGAYSRT